MNQTTNPDLCVPCGEGILNIRVGAIIIKNGRVLMVRNKTGYCYSVGGRVKFGETAQAAVEREVFEETGVRMTVDRLGYVNEVYFLDDRPATFGQPVYEIAFCFYMHTPDDFEPVTDHVADGEERFCWIAPDAKETIYPDFFREAITDPKPYVQHIVRDDR